MQFHELRDVLQGHGVPPLVVDQSIEGCLCIAKQEGGYVLSSDGAGKPWHESHEQAERAIAQRRTIHPHLPVPSIEPASQGGYAVYTVERGSRFGVVWYANEHEACIGVMTRYHIPIEPKHLVSPASKAPSAEAKPKRNLWSMLGFKQEKGPFDR